MPHSAPSRGRRDHAPRPLLTPAAIVLAAVVFATGSTATAQSRMQEMGGDVFVSGSGPQSAVAADRDLFATGPSVTVRGRIAEDTHAFGFSVDVEAETVGDLYAAGMSVALRAPVGEDATAAAGSLRLASGATVGGNARLTGGTVTIEGPISGALSAAGGEVILNGPVAGDAWLTAPKITFGPDAEVGGQLRYVTLEEIDVPDRVATADRVTFEQLTIDDAFDGGWRDWRAAAGPEFRPSASTVAAGLAVTVGFFILLGAIFLGFAPDLVARLRSRITERPANTGLIGAIGLSMLFGAAPIFGLTIIGLPLIPIVVLTIVLAWTLGYLLGAYSVGMGAARSLGLGDDPSIAARLVVLALAVLVVALLNFVPFLGWIANYTLVLLGIGAITAAVFDRFMTRVT